MRSDITGLATPYPLSTMVPAYLQEDSFVVRLLAGLDDVLAPAISVLDCLDAYVDPLLAPDDFVAWLADWVGASLDDNWDESLRRESVLAAAALHRLRGTVPGVRRLVALVTGGDVTVDEPGGASWSRGPTTEAPEQSPYALTIRIAVDDPATVRLSALEELVMAAKPAHLPHTIEVVAR